jgi:glycosyltransferase involved in cell wall biosynthesis
MRRLKVLHLITTLPRLSGAADNTRYTVNLLDTNRYEVHLACGPAELDMSTVRAHVRVIVVGSLVRPVALASDVRALGKLCSLVRREQYDIVHTHNAKAGVLGRVAAKLAGVPVVVHTAHSISFAASASSVTNRLYRVADWLCAPLSDKIITVSKLNTETYLRGSIGRPEQYITIYSGVETANYLDGSHRAACRKELGVSDEDQLVAWIGRLNRQKDPVTFVRAAKLLANRFPQMRFVMVGDDPVGESLEHEVREEVEHLQLESKVRLLG